MLNGFKIISECEGSEECIATINAYGMSFTAQTIINFNSPEYVAFGVNEQTKQLGVAVCTDNENARIFCKNGDAKNAKIAFGAYKDKIAEMMPDWDFNAFNYKIVGTFSEDHKEIVFELLNATPKAKRIRGKRNVPANEMKAVESSTSVEPEIDAVPDNLEEA